MIFEKIILNNMFSYYGESVFDLAGKTEEKNIVLISGRNGFGKTSFLNSIKLLFTGVTNELRSEVQRQRTPSTRQYVVGSGDDWWGIFNRHAKTDSSTCSVEIVWREAGEQITVRREWTVKDNTYDERLTVQLPGRIIEHAEAQAFLDERLPDDYVPFFFFDGEKIQELASANIAQTAEHIERLLNISHVNNLRDALKDAVADWRREGALDQAAEAEFEKVKNELRLVEKQIQAVLQEKKELQDELEQTEKEIAQLQARQENSLSFMSHQEELSAKQRINELKKEQKDICDKIGEELPYDILLLANEKLLKKVQDDIDRMFAENITESSSLVQQLAQFLPDDLFDRPPFPVQPSQRLSEEQKYFYKNKLIKKLAEYTDGQGASANSSFFTLNMAEAAILKEYIQPYLDSRLLRIERKKMFEQLQTVKKKLRQLEDELFDIGSLSEEEKHRYEQGKNELKKKDEDCKALYALLGENSRRENDLAVKQNKLKEDIRKKERNLELTKNVRRKVDAAKRFQNFFNEYKDRLKRHRRVELEEAVNRYFRQLMTSNELIQHIGIDEYFGIHYQDKDNLSVGMGSLAAGMKQLAATSLLWALKTCSGRPMPIIVDTPMARIDKGNQDNLLRYYYPAVSEQVILLPTDSEMDERKYNMLKPYIYQEYVLENKSGSMSSPVRKTMYPAA